MFPTLNTAIGVYIGKDSHEVRNEINQWLPANKEWDAVSISVVYNPTNGKCEGSVVFKRKSKS